MSFLYLFALMFAVGALSTVQPLINGRLALRVGGFLPSAFVSFLVGTVILFLAVLGTGRLAGLRGVTGASWWELCGGLLGATYVSATIVAFPRIGSTAAMAAVISAQLISGLLLDHFGSFGFRQIPLDWQRGLGVTLLLCGALLIVR